MLGDLWHYQWPPVWQGHIFWRLLTPGQWHGKRSKPLSVLPSWQRLGSPCWKPAAANQLSWLSAPFPCSPQANKYICISFPLHRWARDRNHRAREIMQGWDTAWFKVCICLCIWVFLKVHEWLTQKQKPEEMKNVTLLPNRSGNKWNFTHPLHRITQSTPSPHVKVY